MEHHNTNIIRGYAKAIFKIASEMNDKEKFLLWLEYLSAILKDLRVIKIINNNALDYNKKAGFLLGLINSPEQLSLSGNIILFLAKNKHLLLIPKIYEKYEKLYLQLSNKLKVLIISAIDLSNSIQEQLKQDLIKYFNKEIILEYKTDQSIIAGIIIKYRDEVIDCSLKKKLLNLEVKIKC